MFSGIFNKKRFPNDDKMQKIVKESMDRYIRKLDEKYKMLPTSPLEATFIGDKCKCCRAILKREDLKIKIDDQNVSSSNSLISFVPFILFGVAGIYQLYKGLFIKQ